MISDPDKIEALHQAFDFLKRDSGTFSKEFLRTANLVHLDEAEHICDEGGVCTHLALITKGSARVYKLGDNGREITLYRIGPSQSCVLTASCILSDQPFPAFAVAESRIEAVVVPAASVNRWLAESVLWRNYVFGLVASG